MEKKYVLPSNIYKVEKNNLLLYLNPDIPSWLVVDKNAGFLLDLCDGSNSVNEIVDAYVELAGEDKRDTVIRFFNYAEKSRIFEKPSSKDIPIKICRQRLSIVQLSISAKCNLNCKYCYATDRREQNLKQMTFEDYKRVVEEIIDINPKVVFTLTGGEPLLNESCFEIANFIKEKGCKVDILTNGTLIDEHNIDKIKDCFWKVTISIDGSTKELHESFRGVNTYDRTQRAIKLLYDNDVLTYLSMTINRLNIGDVGNMAKKYGKRLHFAPLFPAGNAKASDVDLSVTGREYYNTLFKTPGVNPMGYCESTLNNSLKCRRYKCAIGGAELSISATGDVYPCQLLHYPSFYIGNIHQSSIKDLYYNSEVIQKCSAMTVDNIKGCKDCVIRYICGGACRARAFHEKGDIMVSGDFCEYEKAAFIDGIFKIYSKNIFE